MWRFKTSRIQCFINNMSSLFYVFICVLGCPLWFLGKYNYFYSHLLWKVSIFYLSYICHLRNVTFKFVLCRQLVFYLLIWYEYVQILRCFQTDKFQRSYFTAQLFKCYILYVHSMFLWMQLHVVFFLSFDGSCSYLTKLSCLCLMDVSMPLLWFSKWMSSVRITKCMVPFPTS